MIPGKLVKGMGGAMDLVSGVKRVIVIMDHTNKKGESKFLKECSLPLTGKNVVNSVITNLGMFVIAEKGVKVLEIAEGSTIDDIKKSTEAHIIN